MTTTEELTNFCNRASSSKFITVDTEFVREKTYRPQLCLIQVADEHEAVAIDPLAPGIDLTPLYDLLANESVLKVFHAARQDLEIFYLETGKIPCPIYDTQIAAMVCGFGDSAGYETLVKKFTKQGLDKSSRYTDWSHRPLSAKQIDYALGDVTHLRIIYEKLSSKIERLGRQEWLDDEMHTLTNPQTYEVNPENVWKRVRVRSATPKILVVLRELAAFREREAQKRNIPRGHVMKDDPLVFLASIAPQNMDELKRVRQLDKKWLRPENAKILFEHVAQALRIPQDDWPCVKSHKESPQGHHALVDILKLLLKLKSDESGVASKLLASSHDLDNLARGDHDNLPLLQGWRYEVMGRDAERLMNGELGITFQQGKIKFIDLEG